MKNFVKLIQQVHEERFSAVMNRIASRRLPVAYLSLAKTPQAIYATVNLRAQGLNITNLIVVDNTPPPVNLEFNVVNVSAAAQIYPQPEFVCTFAELDARVAIKNFPAAKVISLNRGNTENIYETFMTHLPELQEVYESLIDEESRRTFRGYWLGNIANRLGEVVFANTPHYICAGFIPERGAVVIDGGLCDGGTAVRFSQMGYQVHGFEPDNTNYLTAAKIGEENNFVVENFGLGSFVHETTFSHAPNPGASKVDPNGTEVVKITTLDRYVREKNLLSVDFIKLDVEGAELDVLRGAATTIARFKPILALSAYHKWDDFWTLMNFVKSLRPDYEFAMRHSFETPEEEPANFTANHINQLLSLGLEPESRSFGECVLFAR